MDRATDWAVATRRYQAKAAGRQLDPKQQKPQTPVGPQTFQEWLDSAEGNVARLLLDAAGEKIFLGMGPARMGWTHSLYFAATTRFIQHDPVLGGVVDFDTDVLAKSYVMTNDEFVRSAMLYHREWRSELDLIAFLRAEIERVAEASP